MKCPSCAAELKEASKECPSCGVILARWREKQARAKVSAVGKSSFEKALAASIAAKETHGRKAALAAWLLVPSFPVLSLSQLLNAVVSRLLARADFVLILVSALLLGALFHGTYLLLLLVLAASVCAVLAWSLRLGPADYGVFLGYSKKVLTPYAFGSILAWIGIANFVPWAAWGAIERTFLWRELESTGATLLQGRLEAPLPVRLSGSKVDWERKAYRVWTGSKSAFFPKSPAVVTEIAAPDQLWELRAQLLGTRVRLPQAPQLDRTLFRTDVPYARCEGCRQETDAGGKYYSLVNGSKGLVWIEGQEMSVSTDSAGGVTGTLVEIQNDQAVYREVWPFMRAGVYWQGVAVRPDLEPQLSDRETWAPLAGTDAGVWLRWRGFLDTAPEGPLEGVYVGIERGEEALHGYIGRQLQVTSQVNACPMVVMMGRREYARWSGLLGRLWTGLDWRSAQVFFGFSLPFFAAAVWFARKE